MLVRPERSREENNNQDSLGKYLHIYLYKTVRPAVQQSSTALGLLGWSDKKYGLGTTSLPASQVICISPVGNAGTSFISLARINNHPFSLLDAFKQSFRDFSRWRSYCEIKSVLYVVMKIVASAETTGIIVILTCNLCSWTRNYPTLIPPIT